MRLAPAKERRRDSAPAFQRAAEAASPMVAPEVMTSSTRQTCAGPSIMALTRLGFTAEVRTFHVPPALVQPLMPSCVSGPPEFAPGHLGQWVRGPRYAATSRTRQARPPDCISTGQTSRVQWTGIGTSNSVFRRQDAGVLPEASTGRGGFGQINADPRASRARTMRRPMPVICQSRATGLPRGLGARKASIVTMHFALIRHPEAGHRRSWH